MLDIKNLYGLWGIPEYHQWPEVEDFTALSRYIRETKSKLTKIEPAEYDAPLTGVILYFLSLRKGYTVVFMGQDENTFNVRAITAKGEAVCI